MDARHIYIYISGNSGARFLCSLSWLMIETDRYTYVRTYIFESNEWQSWSIYIYRNWENDNRVVKTRGPYNNRWGCKYYIWTQKLINWKGICEYVTWPMQSCMHKTTGTSYLHLYLLINPLAARIQSWRSWWTIPVSFE